ncbi:MAG TPA: FAD-dependent oxidoreductase [Candidatus Saccharimonadales bacterium]|jgi:NADH dehydrogenase
MTAQTTKLKKQKVLIIGAGFAGIKTALELAEDAGRFDITVLSDQTDFRYYPSLYRTATGGNVAGSIIPLKSLFDDSKITLLHGEATTLDRKTRTIGLQDGQTVQYDALVIGLGVVTNYFGIPGMQELSYSIKSPTEIKRFKEHLHKQIEDDRAPDLNYVIVGAGPTGIELSGALPEYLKQIMANHGIKHKAAHIDLIEAAPRLLPRMPKDTSLMVAKRLRKIGVKLYTGKVVEALAADQLSVSGKPIRSHTVIWTAGVSNHPFFKNNGFAMTPRGKVSTDMYLQAEDNIYVVGDNANTPYSGMAQTALHDGIYVAGNLKRKADGKDPKSYKIKKPITVIPVGEQWAAVVWGKIRLYGRLGWVLREFADLIAFADYLPWWKAGRQWLTSFEAEEACTVCRHAQRQAMTDK